MGKAYWLDDRFYRPDMPRRKQHCLLELSSTFVTYVLAYFSTILPFQ